MTEYVAGFLFDETKQYVVLIEKRRPRWQAGRWNAVGGHVERKTQNHTCYDTSCDVGGFDPCNCPYETPLEAMRREFREETGMDVEKWDHFCTLSGDGFRVYWHRAFCHPSRIFDAKTVTDERVYAFFLKRLPENTITNLRWLIEMALSMDNDRAESFEIREQYVA